jgi:hypothetical protein
MKCLMRTFAEEDKGVVFYETVMSLRQQRHTVIECVPVPREQFTELPAYFRVRFILLLASAILIDLYRNLFSCPSPNGLNTRN